MVEMKRVSNVVRLTQRRGGAESCADEHLPMQAGEGGAEPDLDRDGTIAVSGGVISHTKPAGKGKWPVIIPGRNVSVYYDNQLVTQPTVVFDGNLLQVVPAQKAPVSKFKVHVSEDRTEVVLSVRFVPGKIYRAPDCLPAQRLRIDGQAAGEIPPEPIDEGLVHAELKRLGIKAPIMRKVIQAACQGCADQDVVIARGKAPSPSQDGKVEYVCSFDERLPVENDDSERIDYYNKGAINCVQAGTVLAFWTPPVLGEPGLSVFGEVIEPRDPKNKVLKVGPGVQLIDNGRIAVATIDGRPCLSGPDLRLSVIPLLEINGDVDLTTGHIEFYGDVLVRGNVNEGLKVHAGGRVVVVGDVYQAEIVANGNIAVHGKVIGSKIIAGSDQTRLVQIGSILGRLIIQLPELIQAGRQLEPYFEKTKSAALGEEYLIRLLLEMKFATLDKNLKTLEQLKGSLIDLGNPILHRIANLDCKLDSFRCIEELYDECLELREEIKAELTSKVDVEIDYCQNSEIEATGKITATGELVYDSKLTAGDSIWIQGECRGGSLNAQTGIASHVLGCPGGTITHVRVAADGTVKADLIHSNVNLQFGIYTYPVPYEMSQVAFTLQDEKIVANYTRKLTV